MGRDVTPRSMLEADADSEAVAYDGESSESPFVIRDVRNIREIAQLTGPGAMNDTPAVGVDGCDLGSMFTWHDRTYFLFGDNFDGRPDDAVGAEGDVWRSNALAWTTDSDPADGITLDGWIDGADGLAREILPGKHQADGVGEVTKIPTQGFAVEGNLYVAYMSVRHWGAPGEWDANEARLARSIDQGQTWEVLPEIRWPGDSGFIQLAHARLEAEGRQWLYLWGIPAGRFGSVRLLRMPYSIEGVENQSSWEYFAGLGSDQQPRWSMNLDDSHVVLEGHIGEFSVLWSARFERWLLTTMDNNGSAVLYEGLHPWGPWGAPHVLLTQKERPGFYAPYTDPRYVSPDGSRVWFTLSVWGPYNVFWYSMDLVGPERG